MGILSSILPPKYYMYVDRDSYYEAAERVRVQCGPIIYVHVFNITSNAYSSGPIEMTIHVRNGSPEDLSLKLIFGNDLHPADDV